MQKISVLVLLSVFRLVFAQDFILTNGMSGYAHSQYGTGMISLVAVVKCGVRTETASTNGISHYLEHLLFNGTLRYNQEEFYKKLDNYGIYANAQTGKDYIAFMMIGPVEFRDTIANLLKEQLFYSILPEDKFEKEKGIVLQEMARSELDDDYLFEVLFDLWDKEGTPYSLPILGTKASLQRIQRKEVVEYYKTWFHPNNMILLVSGDLSKSDLIKLSQNTFQDIPAGDIPVEKNFKFRSYTHNTFFKTEQKSEQLFRFHGRIGPFPTDSIRQIVAMEIVTNLFSPLDFFPDLPLKKIELSLFRDRNGVLLEFEGWSQSDLEPDSIFKLIQQSFIKFVKKDFNQSKLESFRARRRWDEMRSTEQIQYWGLMRAGKLVQNTEQYWNQYDKVLQTIPIHEVIQRFQDVLQLPYGIVYEGKSKNTVSIENTRAQFFSDSLPNGLKFFYRKESGSKLVGGHILIRDRSKREPKGKEGIVELLHTFVQEYGPMSLPISKWKDTLASLGAVVKCADDPNIPFDDYYTSSAFSFIRFDVPEENFNQFIHLIADALKHPRIEEDYLKDLKSALLRRIKKDVATPKHLANTLFNQKIYGESFLSSPYGTVESIESITVQDLIQFSESYFTANSMIVTLDGNLSFENVQNTVTSAFWEFVSISYPRDDRNVHSLPSGVFEIKAGKTQSYVMLVGEFQELEDTLIPIFETQISLLSNIIQMKLREEKGWAYSLGANYKKINDKFFIFLQIGCNQSVVDSAIQELKIIYNEFRSKKIDFDEFQRVQNANWGRQRMREASRQYRAFAMSMAVMNNMPIESSVRRNIQFFDSQQEMIEVVRKKLPPIETFFIVR
ncbi:MAG: insulinase family protein [bacterium]|nr:insulinase family protein [bacterium]